MLCADGQEITAPSKCWQIVCVGAPSGNTEACLICRLESNLTLLAVVALPWHSPSAPVQTRTPLLTIKTAPAPGGAVTTGGASSAPSSSITGGNSNVGGNAASGGVAATSSSATGGALATAGSVATGGQLATGGMPTTGGSPSSAGSSSVGGTRVTGGTSNAGGIASTTGGAQSAGGTYSAGGSNPPGGSTAVGGNTSAGTLPALHVEGNLLKDPNGKTIILRGVSLIDIGQLYYNAKQSSSGITTRIDKILAAGLEPHVIRLPVYPRTVTNGNSPAYSQAPYPLGPNAPAGRTQLTLTSDQYVTDILKPAVDYATQQGMYAIIDYHQIDNTDDTTRTSAADATTFWTTIAPLFKNNPNVLYEPFNEPIDSTTPWATFKSRAQGWVTTIRDSGATDNIIIVPSMSYCQKPGDAAASPLDGTNLMYTAHIYPGNWLTAFKNQVSSAVALVPVFITEWGYDLNSTQNPTGTTVTTWGTDFRTLVDGYGASWTAWVTDNSWTPKIFSDAALTQLTDFGTLTSAWLATTNSSDWVK